VSAEAVGWVFQNSQLSGNALVVHLALADVANDVHDNMIWMHHKQLADKARTSVSTVQRVLGQLVEQGYLEHLDDEAARARRKAQHLGVRYRFLMRPIGQSDRSVDRSPMTEPIGQSDRSRSVTGDRSKEPKGELKPEPNNLLVEPEARPVSVEDAAADSFEAFWMAYPRRVAKGTALRAWTKAVKALVKEGMPNSQAIAVIIAGVDRYAEAVRGKEAQYVAHPASWLNAQRWLDEPDPTPGRKTRAPKIDTDRSGPSGEYDPWEGIE
jgi:hypothetical protein